MGFAVHCSEVEEENWRQCIPSGLSGHTKSYIVPMERFQGMPKCSSMVVLREFCYLAASE